MKPRLPAKQFWVLFNSRSYHPIQDSELKGQDPLGVLPQLHDFDEKINMNFMNERESPSASSGNRRDTKETVCDARLRKNKKLRE